MKSTDLRKSTGETNLPEPPAAQTLTMAQEVALLGHKIDVLAGYYSRCPFPQQEERDQVIRLMDTLAKTALLLRDQPGIRLEMQAEQGAILASFGESIGAAGTITEALNDLLRKLGR